MSRNHIILSITLSFFLLGLPATAQSQQEGDSTEVTLSESEEVANEFYQEGEDHLASGNDEAALASYEQGLDTDSTSAFNAYGKGRALARLGQFVEAAEALQLAAELAPAEDTPELEEAIASLTDQVAERVGKSAYSEATSQLSAGEVTAEVAGEVLSLLETAEAHGIESAGLSYNFARVYNALGRHTEAIPHAEAAVTADGSDEDLSPYYIELGIAKMNTGDTDGARDAFENAKNGSWASWAEHYLGQLNAQ